MNVIDPKSKALIDYGLFQPVDLIPPTLVSLIGVTGFFWSVFGNPSALSIAILLLICGNILLVWTILLIFRVGRFVAEMRASVELLPTKSAQLLADYYRGVT